MRVIIGGITGHTGIAVARHIDSAPDLDLVAAVGNRSVGRDIADILGSGRSGRHVYPDVKSAVVAHPAEVYVDFTAPKAAENTLPIATELGLNLIVGTTGISEQTLEIVSRNLVSRGRFGVISSNFSLGAFVLARSLRLLANLFGSANIEILESHNVSKVDHPSGTALYLQQLVEASEERPIPVHWIRVAGHVSRHEIRIHEGSQTLSIVHDVTSPDAFASGVLYALRNYRGQVGVYPDLASFVSVGKDG
jgi:4-hydroxy-tetrahydrodipicolinate reductase